jgi:hypothetical protein
MNNPQYKPYETTKESGYDIKKMNIIGKSAYFFCSGSISTLVALLSLLLVFSLVSLVTTGAIPGVNIPTKITPFAAACILLLVYTIIILSLKALRYSLIPHKSYSLYGGRSEPKYGDSTIWLAFFILLAWYISEHRTELAAYLGNFPAWWRNVVDMVGPWFYK